MVESRWGAVVAVVALCLIEAGFYMFGDALSSRVRTWGVTMVLVVAAVFAVALMAKSAKK